MSFISYKNRKLKVKLWWVAACEKRKRAFFVPIILPEGIFFKMCILSQCIVYWIHFQTIHTFAYQKTLLHTLSLLVSKIVESLQCILNLKISLQIFFHSERFWGSYVTLVQRLQPNTHLAPKCLNTLKYYHTIMLRW